MLAVGSDAQFANLCKTLKRPDLIESASFKSNTDRLKHRKDLMSALNEAASPSNATTCSELLVNKVPAGAIFNVKEALDQSGVRSAYVVNEDGLKRMKTSAIAPGGFETSH